MLRFCNLETLSQRERMKFVPMQFLRPVDDEIADRIPASIYLAPWWMRTIDRIPVQIGWKIKFKGHWWRVVEVRWDAFEKRSKSADQYPIYYCEHIGEAE